MRQMRQSKNYKKITETKGYKMNDAPELYAIVKEWEKELKRKKKQKKDVK